MTRRVDTEALAALAAAGLPDSEIADVLGVTARAIRMARKRSGIPSTWTRAVPLCGTLASYRRGCGCPPCRAANAAHAARYAPGGGSGN